MNKRRKADKAQKIGDHHFEKSNYKSALKSYRRFWKYDKWFHIRDNYLYKVAYSYKCLWDYEKALKVMEYLKNCGTYTYNSLELKKELLEYLWHTKQAEECQKELDTIDKKISDNTLLDSYLKHTS